MEMQQGSAGFASGVSAERHYIIWPQRRWVDGETLVTWARDAYDTAHPDGMQDVGHSPAAIAAVPNSTAARELLNDYGDVTFGREPDAPRDPGAYDPEDPDAGDEADWRQDNEAFCDYAAGRI